MNIDWLTIPAGVFLLLWGLIWKPKPKMKKNDMPDLLLAEDVTAFKEFEIKDSTLLTPKQLRGYLIRIAIRILILGIGILGIIVNFIEGIGTFEHMDVFGLLAGLYAALIMVVQRSIPSRRLLTLFVMGFVALLIWRTAELRDYGGENNVAVLVASLLNLGFWGIIGRHYPPQEDTIIVEE